MGGTMKVPGNTVAALGVVLINFFLVGIFIVNFVNINAKSNWLEGVLL